MIEFEDAISIIGSIDARMGIERVNPLQSLSRVLAKDVISDTDMPPFNKSAMDGFACRAEDLNDVLTIVEDIPAGKVPSMVIGKGHCARIMTGAPIPVGADFILMKEHAEITGMKTIRRIRTHNAPNICYAGEDTRAGSTVLVKGTRILPQHIAVMVAVGCIEPDVYKLPDVAILSTGNELTHPSVKPDGGKIRNSNGFQISAQLLESGISPADLGIVIDDRNKIHEILSGEIERHDLLIISGGVSVGDYDFIPDVLNSLGIDIMFRGLNIKPGKHALMGRKQDHYIVALPGNPVSAFVLTEVVIRPLIDRLTGLEKPPRWVSLKIETDYQIKNSNMLNFIPVRMTPNGNAEPVPYHGSAHIHAYTEADGIMEIPAGKGVINKGESVHVRPL